MAMIKIPPPTHIGKWLEIEEGQPSGDPEMAEVLEVAIEDAERNRRADAEGWKRRIDALKKQLEVERDSASKKAARRRRT